MPMLLVSEAQVYTKCMMLASFGTRVTEIKHQNRFLVTLVLHRFQSHQQKNLVFLFQLHLLT